MCCLLATGDVNKVETAVSNTGLVPLFLSMRDSEVVKLALFATSLE